MPDHPMPIVPLHHFEPAPRRIRAMLAGSVILDTVRARYVWESAHYPQYYVPVADIDPASLVDEQRDEPSSLGSAHWYGLRARAITRPRAVRIFAQNALECVAGMARLEWDALDAWFEEDEAVFVHPRSPYTRVDALRSSRHVRIERDGVLLAESSSPVLVFETGLLTRYYLDRTDVRFEHLVPSSTVTACPYKGRTGGYWSAQAGGRLHRDIAWSYEFPTPALAPIAGMIAFYNERVDISLDGRALEREARARPEVTRAPEERSREPIRPRSG